MKSDSGIDRKKCSWKKEKERSERKKERKEGEEKRRKNRREGEKVPSTISPRGEFSARVCTWTFYRFEAIIGADAIINASVSRSPVRWLSGREGLGGEKEERRRKSQPWVRKYGRARAGDRVCPGCPPHEIAEQAFRWGTPLAGPSQGGPGRSTRGWQGTDLIHLLRVYAPGSNEGLRAIFRKRALSGGGERSTIDHRPP